MTYVPLLLSDSYFHCVTVYFCETSKTILKTHKNKGSFTVTHRHISTGSQKPLGNNMEVRGLRDLGQLGMGGRHQVLVKMLNDQMDLDPCCQH